MEIHTFARQKLQTAKREIRTAQWLLRGLDTRARPQPGDDPAAYATTLLFSAAVKIMAMKAMLGKLDKR